MDAYLRMVPAKMNHKKEWNNLRDLLYRELYDKNPNFTQIDIEFAKVLLRMLAAEAKSRGLKPYPCTGISGILYFYRLLH